MSEKHDGLQDIIDEALSSMAAECAGEFDPQTCNLSEFCRRTGLTRQRARTIRANGFKVKPHGRTGQKAAKTVPGGYTGFVDDLLRKGVTNSQVVFDRLVKIGYKGGLTMVKSYIRKNRHLVPAKRKKVAPQGNRGRRFRTDPGEAYQMDWGFLKVADGQGAETRIACFAMVCHHCGMMFVEFFPNARQENLCTGMVHAFMSMGVPDHVLSDNMKSVVTRRDSEGQPVWNSDYAAFMSDIGFKTRLCKPRHPFTKGKSERLIEYVKQNFAVGREFSSLTQLNEEVEEWCATQNGRYRRAIDCVPAERHTEACLPRTHEIADLETAEMYLCPRRAISFDGFVCYEGRRFGVPYWYEGQVARVSREGWRLHVYSEDLSRELVTHEVTWSRADSWCEDQWADVPQPEELPTQPVTTTLKQSEPPEANPAYSRFDFGRMV
jgi:transposase